LSSKPRNYAKLLNNVATPAWMSLLSIPSTEVESWETAEQEKGGAGSISSDSWPAISQGGTLILVAGCRE